MKKRIAIFIILIIAIVFIIGVRTEPGRVIYGTDNTVTISKNEYERLVRNNEALKKYLLLEEAREFVQELYKNITSHDGWRHTGSIARPSMHITILRKLGKPCGRRTKANILR